MPKQICWTLIRHKGYTVSGLASFMYAVETCQIELTEKSFEALSQKGVVLVDNLTKAKALEETYNFQHAEKGSLVPKAKGGFIKFRKIPDELFIPENPIPQEA